MTLSEMVHGHDPKPELVEIKVNYRLVRVPERVTGTRIKEAAGLNPTFELYKVVGDEETLIDDDEEIHVHQGEEFVATPGLEPA